MPGDPLSIVGGGLLWVVVSPGRDPMSPTRPVRTIRAWSGAHTCLLAPLCGSLQRRESVRGADEVIFCPIPGTGGPSAKAQMGAGRLQRSPPQLALPLPALSFCLWLPASALQAPRRDWAGAGAVGWWPLSRGLLQPSWHRTGWGRGGQDSLDLSFTSTDDSGGREGRARPEPQCPYLGSGRPWCSLFRVA